MKTILITGCSSGFGLETAKYFLAQGWKVVATMRTPREDLFPASENLRIIALDVTSEASIRQAVEAAGPIDALVNNAGIGMMNAVEGVSIADVRGIFETNTIGTIAVTSAVLPQFRERKSGVVVNVTSSITFLPLPLVSVYRASKIAVNAFSESLAQEVKQFGVRVHVVLPGRAPDTQFAENAQVSMAAIPEPYAELAQNLFASFADSNSPVTHSSDVAVAVWQAVTDPSTPMHLPAGADAIEWAKAS